MFKFKSVIDNIQKKNHDRVAHKDGFIGSELNFVCKEAYSLLRTNVSFALSSISYDAKVIGVTSAMPNDGKSYTSINLAYAFALSKKKTLLINADMRNPSYSRVFNTSEKVGLSTLFLNNDADVINKDVLIENLDVIFSGAIPPNPAELLGSEAMRDIIDGFRENYDYIIIDLPPVNVVADACVVSPYCDGMILVARHGFSRKKDIRSAVSQLSFVKAPLLGFVYNDFSHSSGSYYKKRRYYSKNQYGYGYGYGYGGYGQQPENKLENQNSSIEEVNKEE